MMAFAYPTDSQETIMRDVVLGALANAFKAFNRVVPWFELPTPLAVANLAALRRSLQKDNLHSVPESARCPYARKLEGSYPECVHARSPDGSYNDLSYPAMGSTGTRFGRNVPLGEIRHDTMAAMLTPSPRTVSNKLLARREFKPATSLNLLAAAWIQFMTHDWFSHGEREPEAPIEVPLPPGDPWPRSSMLVGRTKRDAHSEPHEPITFRNEVTHWWDASQLYGSDGSTQARVREHRGGRLRIGDDGHLHVDPSTNLELTGFNGAWWSGLTFLHTLFVREHNAVCGMLSQHYPDWSDQQLFDTARCIVAALLAKIHTVEWTPGILGSPALHLAMNANWWGLASEQVKRIWGRISDSDEISGLVGSPTDHWGEPFAITEEFVSVYRLHPLMPDQIDVRSASHGRTLARKPMFDFLFERARGLVESGQASMADLGYSLGTAHPGRIELHNYPEFLRNLHTFEGEDIDLAAVDVLRDRERGTPRYNRFRELLGKPRARTFADITDNKKWAEELREVYEDVDQVDLMVGMLAETPPPGFGFSDTAFRVFILMASRRLKSDRFFTTDYGPHVYTPEGLRWLDENNMRTVLLRHYPELRLALRNVQNGFAPWNEVAAQAEAEEPRTKSRPTQHNGQSALELDGSPSAEE